MHFSPADLASYTHLPLRGKLINPVLREKELARACTLAALSLPLALSLGACICFIAVISARGPRTMRGSCSRRLSPRVRGTPWAPARILIRGSRPAGATGNQKCVARPLLLPQYQRAPPAVALSEFCILAGAGAHENSSLKAPHGFFAIGAGPVCRATILLRRTCARAARPAACVTRGSDLNTAIRGRRPDESEIKGVRASPTPARRCKSKRSPAQRADTRSSRFLGPASCDPYLPRFTPERRTPLPFRDCIPRVSIRGPLPWSVLGRREVASRATGRASDSAITRIWRWRFGQEKGEKHSVSGLHPGVGFR